MRVRFSRIRKVSSIVSLTIILMVVIASPSQGAKGKKSCLGNVSPNTEIVGKAVFQEPISVSFSKTPCLDWALAEVVEDLPQVQLRNSLNNWIADYSRNPFYVFNSALAP